jgi:hypothetical protein
MFGSVAEDLGQVRVSEPSCWVERVTNPQEVSKTRIGTAKVGSIAGMQLPPVGPAADRGSD